ncbi:hypothetical protein NDU88_002758 [Pleurodeles waltl]|uniref:Uncharacterized protein n=1 Tax=Pleurodeles waltl TaxID=8319 RepID=A0AAV7VBH4_PLEWA|nr:hypothetical protein NDU88_002758 [Pleurodeles waltl]
MLATPPSPCLPRLLDAWARFRDLQKTQRRSGTEGLEEKHSEQPSQLSNGPQRLNSRTARNPGTPSEQSPAPPCRPL